MADRYWIFHRTDEGWRMDRLRDMHWNEALGFVLIAVVLVVAAVTRSLGVW